MGLEAGNRRGVFADDIAALMGDRSWDRLAEPAAEKVRQIEDVLLRFGLKLNRDETMNIASSPMQLS